tara:strand:+ start:733 stop:1827 length:1095 start_codon:yes stop_codon:yes gene_type:complete
MGNQDLIQEKAFKVIDHRTGLAMSMGSGKTRIAIKHMLDGFDPLMEVLVVAPKKSIFQSWIDEIDKMECYELKNHITFSTYLSLNKQDPEAFTFVYLDECHSLLESHESFLSLYKGGILGLTGTPPDRKGSEKYKMVQKYCPIKFEFSVDDATDKKIVNDYRIIIHTLQLSKVPNYQKNTKNGGKWFTSEQKDYEYITKAYTLAQTQKERQFLALMRMRALMDYKTKELYMKGLINNINSKCLIFANTHKQADRVCTHSYHSGNSDSDYNFELFCDGRINKMSCVLQLSEGVNIPDLKQGIIMHAYGNNRKTAQRIGRLLRLNPNDRATCHILCYAGTVDETWVNNAVKEFDQKKITYYNPLKL